MGAERRRNKRRAAFGLSAAARLYVLGKHGSPSPDHQGDKDMADQAGAGNSGGTATAQASLTVNAQYIKDLSFESPNVIQIMSQQEAGTPQVNFNLGVAANPVANDSYEVVLTIRAEAKRETMTAFIIELAYGGVFTIKGFPQDQIEPILFIEAPRLLFPFARGIISDVTRDGGFTPMMLNPIDFVELYRRRLAERQGQSAADAPVAGMPN